MKTQIRMGVFETNSSSMHSLCVMKNEGKYTLQEITHDMWLWDDSKTGEKNCIWMPYEGDLYFGRSPFRHWQVFLINGYMLVLRWLKNIMMIHIKNYYELLRNMCRH